MLADPVPTTPCDAHGSAVAASARACLAAPSPTLCYPNTIYAGPCTHPAPSLQVELKLTGELSTNMLSEGEGPLPEYGVLVGPGVNAQHHQHM